MDGFKERFATINKDILSSQAGDDFKLLKSVVFKMSRADLVAAREASPEVWTFLAKFVDKRSMFRSQVGSVTRALAADEGWRRSLEMDVDFRVLDALEFAFADQAACAHACTRLQSRGAQHPSGKQESFYTISEWQALQERVCRRDFAGANEEFRALRSSVLASTPPDLDRQSERAGLVFEFLIGFGSLRGKRHFQRQITEVVRTLMQVPSWREIFLDHVELQSKALGLDEGLRAAFDIPEIAAHFCNLMHKPADKGHIPDSPDLRSIFDIARTDIDSHQLAQLRRTSEPEVENHLLGEEHVMAGPDPLSPAEERPAVQEMPMYSSLSVPRVRIHEDIEMQLCHTSACPGGSELEGVSRWRSLSEVRSYRIDNAAANLRTFVESHEGQDLIWRVFECYEFIVEMATFCRNRSRFGHGTTRVLAGAASAGGATAVIVGAAMMAASSGAAAPLAAPVLIAGFTAGAVGAGMSLANSLTMLGWDAANAKTVETKINELKSRIKDWDHHMNEMLQAIAEGKEGESADAPNIANDIAMVLADYGASASSLYSVAVATFRASYVTSNTWSAAAPAALGGAVKAGTVAATSLTIVFSAATVVFGLVESICGGMQIWSGYCEAADSLDAHADKFCAILRLMKEAARGTDVQMRLRGKLPWLVLVQVNTCKLPKPDYRGFDHTKKIIGKALARPPSSTRVYFEFQMGKRIRHTDALVKVTADTRCAIGQAILTRIFPKDKLQVHVQARDRRGIQSYLRGDPAMGRQLRLQIRQNQQHTLLKLPSGNTKIHVSYWLVRGDRWVHPLQADAGPSNNLVGSQRLTNTPAE